MNGDAVSDINAAAGGSFAIGCRLHAITFGRAIRFSSGSEYRQHELVLEEEGPARAARASMQQASWTRIKSLYR